MTFNSNSSTFELLNDGEQQYFDSFLNSFLGDEGFENSSSFQPPAKPARQLSVVTGQKLAYEPFHISPVSALYSESSNAFSSSSAYPLASSAQYSNNGSARSAQYPSSQQPFSSNSPHPLTYPAPFTYPGPYVIQPSSQPTHQPPTVVQEPPPTTKKRASRAKKAVSEAKVRKTEVSPISEKPIQSSSAVAVQKIMSEGISDFQTKARISSARPSEQPKGLLTDQEKKHNHVVSEQRRRQAIKEGFDEIVRLTPILANGPVNSGPGNTGGGHSKSTILVAAAQYIRELKEEVEALKKQATSPEESSSSVRSFISHSRHGSDSKNLVLTSSFKS